MTDFVNAVWMNKKRDNVTRAAAEVFLRYGYSRTTMNDIAKSAGISRPALYLIFQSKEEVFAEVTTMVFNKMLEQIYAELANQKTPEDKLIFLFDVWFVQPFKTIQSYPDASDLMENICQYAGDIKSNATIEFRKIVADVIKTLNLSADLKYSNEEIALTLSNAANGLKLVAKNSDELSEQVKCLVRLVLLSSK